MSTTTGLTFTESGGSYISASDTITMVQIMYTFYGTLSNVNAIKYRNTILIATTQQLISIVERLLGLRLEYFGGTNHFYKATEA